MKKDTHPKYFHNCKVFHNGELVMTCGATVPELHVDVWSGSHPFFTGKQAFVDSAGRVERFQRVRRELLQGQEEGLTARRAGEKEKGLSAAQGIVRADGGEVGRC